MTENEKTTIYMWLVHEDFRLQNQLTTLYNNLLNRTANTDDLIRLILLRQKIADFNEFKQDLLYLLNLET